MPPDRDTTERISSIPRHWAAEAPWRVAVVESGHAVTYAQLWEHIEAAQHYLRSQGVGPGDRVLIVAENCLAVITLVFALSELCAWPVVVNARLSTREVEEIRAHCHPRLMLFSHAASPAALRHGVRYRAREVAPAGLGPLMAGAVDETSDREPEALAREVAALIYTSGTTGHPKGVMVTHRGLLHFARVTVQSRHMLAEDCAYAVMPISHVFGLGTLLLSTFQAGASLYLSARFNAADVTTAIRHGAITLLQGEPTVFRRILEHVRRSGALLAPSARLRYLYAGGGPLDPTLKQEVEEMFGRPLHHGYGLTEYAGSLCVTRMDRPRSDCSAGEIVAGAELRVVAPNGDLVQQGSLGELWVRGPGVMRGYYRAPALTDEVLRPEGWLKTGDLGRLDPDGALFIVARAKDLITRSGFNVYPNEVESVLNTHPSVRLSAVVGQPAVDGNEEVIAFVETKDGKKFDAQALQEYLTERLLPYKRPQKILRVVTIPTTASGKPVRYLLKHQLAQMVAEKA